MPDHTVTTDPLSAASWDDLRTFLAVVRTGSLSRAAEALGITQPTVGRRLDRLEEAFDFPLIRRTTQGCTATARGARLVPLVERMREAADGVARVASSTSNDLQGVVRIAVGDLMARHIARHLPTLLADAPGLRVEVVSGLDFVQLERGEADIAIRNRAPEGDHWVKRPMPASPYAIYGSQAYAEMHPDAFDDEKRWSTCAWVSFERGRTTATSTFIQARATHPPVVGFSNSLLILEAAACGMGLTMLPMWLGDDDPRLCRVSDPLPDFEMRGFLVMHPSARRLRRVRWMASQLVELFSHTEEVR
ncbi:MAG: LysR family transcriptional regulator [Bradymonadia bacterium]